MRKIQQGIGGIDAAADLVSLANLFDKNARKLRGKSSIGAAEVKRAAELGSELLSLLRPKGAKPATDVERQKAAEVRDRLWTLLVRHHEHLRRVAMWLWGDAAGGHVPALQARVSGQRRRPPSDAASTAPAAPA